MQLLRGQNGRANYIRIGETFEIETVVKKRGRKLRERLP